MENLQLFIRDFILTIKNYRAVFPFIKVNQLWKGMFSYSWVSQFLLVVGALLSLKFGGLFTDWYDNTVSQGMSMNAVGSLLSETAAEGYDLFVMGSYKYIILILLEVVIFHFARKTLEVLTGETAASSLHDFIKAQVRMIKVVLFSFIMETIFSFATNLVLANILGYEIVAQVIVFFIQCFFLGFAVVDNYNEIYELSIKKSFKYTQQYAGVAIGVGIVIYVLMLIPVLGAVLAPILGAVTATMTMYELNKEDESLEEVLVMDKV